MQLSPLTRHSITARQLAPMDCAATKPRRAIEEVLMYRCPECLELHEWEDEAKDCCTENVAHCGADHDSTHCPVCGQQHIDYQDAADCCLWKDLDIAARWRLAAAVEDGSTWAEALGSPFAYPEV